MKIIKISAKCSNLFAASLYDGGTKLIGTYNGYVPSFMPGNLYGVYVNMSIDIETGKIINWKTPTAEDLKIVFGYVEPKQAQIPKGGVKIKEIVYDSLKNLPKKHVIDRGLKRVNDLLARNARLNSRLSNKSHLKLKRDSQGHFIKMDTIAEFDYPHNGELRFRMVKVEKEGDGYIEGVQYNSQYTGYKRFNLNRVRGLYKYKGYVKDAV